MQLEDLVKWYDTILIEQNKQINDDPIIYINGKKRKHDTNDETEDINTESKKPKT